VTDETCQQSIQLGQLALLPLLSSANLEIKVLCYAAAEIAFIHTPHNSWRSLISGGCRTSMQHSTTTGSGRAFSSCLPAGTEDCAVPVVLSG